MGRISMWSLNRDTQGTAKTYVDDTSSSITQNAFDFSNIFEDLRISRWKGVAARDSACSDPARGGAAGSVGSIA